MSRHEVLIHEIYHRYIKIYIPIEVKEFDLLNLTLKTLLVV